MIRNKKKFILGSVMMIAFVAVLLAMFIPIYGGRNGLQYMDELYNSISKGSAYYIPKVAEETKVLDGKAFELTLAMASAEEADQTAKLLNGAGALVNVSDTEIKVSGDLGKIMAACLADADAMYYNKGEVLQSKYGYDARQALFNWYQVNRVMEKTMTKEKMFDEAEAVMKVREKAVETAYNYFGIEGRKISSQMGIVIFSLIFYVIYTVWYGFGIMFLFEGIGMQLEH